MKALFCALMAVLVLFTGLKTAGAEDNYSYSYDEPPGISSPAVEVPNAPPATKNVRLTPPDEAFSGIKAPVDEVGGLCDSCCDGCCSSGLNGLFRSDWEFSTFVEPITNPLYFEDPRSMTRARFVFLNQMIPEGSILGGGDLQVYALQVTVALNERLAFIANRDGYLSLQADALPNQTGWADLGTGLKYVFLRDPCNQFLLSGGFLYEWSQGSEDVFQGNGDGVWNFFLTTGKGWDNSHFVGTLGWHLPNNGSDETQSMFYSLHLDYMLTCRLYALWEFTGIHYLESGRALPGVTVEGGDLINLGAGAVAGNHFASTAFGMMYRLTDQMTLGAAYEFPVTDREDLMDNRTTVNLSWTY